MAWITDLTTPRGWSLIVGLAAAAVWTLARGIGDFEHSWMPQRSWVRSSLQAVVAGIGVGLVAYIGWDDYPPGPGPKLATIVAIGLGWAAVGSAAGAAIAPASGTGGLPAISEFIDRLIPVDNRISGVVERRLAARSMDELTAAADRAREVASSDPDAIAANKRRLDSAADRGKDDLVASLRKLIVANKITRGALSGQDGFFKRWPP